MPLVHYHSGYTVAFTVMIIIVLYNITVGAFDISASNSRRAIITIIL